MKHFLIIVFACALSNNVSAQHFILHAVLENAINIDTVAVNSNYVDSTVNAAISSIDLSQVEESQDLIDSMAAVRLSLSNFSGGLWSTSGTSAYYNDGNVGIGINSPETKLHVLKSGVAMTGLKTATVAAFQNSSAQTSQAFLSLISGNAATNSGLQFGDADDEDAGGVNYRADNNKMSFRTAGVSNRMVIDNSGNVGVGLSDPSEKLEVGGNILLRSSSGGNNASPAYQKLKFESNGGVYDAGEIATSTRSSNSVASQMDLSVYANIVSGQPIPLIHLDGATENVILAGSGYVGVGTTTPSERLDVNGNVKAVEFHGDGSNLTGISGDGFEANTDNQSIDTLNLNGTTLEVSISGDDEPAKTLDLSSLSEADVENAIDIPYDPDFENNPSYGDGKYYKHEERVYIDGTFKRKSGPLVLLETIATLPSGYRPSSTSIFKLTDTTIFINPDGTIDVGGIGSSNSDHFQGLSFRVN